MSENPSFMFSGVGILGTTTPSQRTTFDQVMQLKFNPEYRKNGPPPAHMYEAYRRGAVKEKFDGTNFASSQSTLTRGNITGKPIQAYAIGRDGVLYPEVVVGDASVENYASIYDDPYQPYSYYTKYATMKK